MKNPNHFWRSQFLKVIIVSDVHLGFSNSDKLAFNRFLDYLSQDRNLTDLVLLGDIVDMWRRDASGVFLESRDSFEKITTLALKAGVHYVAGNHDYHVLKLQDHSYPLNFVMNLAITDRDYTYKIMHGYEFDSLQEEPLMEALCRVMSDEAGDFESGVWATLTRTWSDFEYFLSILSTRKRKIKAEAEKLQAKPEERLKETLGDLERTVCSLVQPKEIIVFGHTHQPFINEAENVVNTGSWVLDAPVHNTYVELSDGKPKLFVFEGEEIQERLKC